MLNSISATIDQNSSSVNKDFHLGIQHKNNSLVRTKPTPYQLQCTSNKRVMKAL